eukprot:TRINITY_DN1540_c1_g1_i4.p1 TRINITY_DN1540_c1_g1~~TRINITY_DN1540_c1_g1_i4.p1  ORF type:complete len:125 (+),score=5.71 TRINITY_DN1540_c1_g1_i4:208-582(+)
MIQPETPFSISFIHSILAFIIETKRGVLNHIRLIFRDLDRSSEFTLEGFLDEVAKVVLMVPDVALKINSSKSGKERVILEGKFLIDYVDVEPLAMLLLNAGPILYFPRLQIIMIWILDVFAVVK